MSSRHLHWKITIGVIADEIRPLFRRHLVDFLQRWRARRIPLPSHSFFYFYYIFILFFRDFLFSFSFFLSLSHFVTIPSFSFRLPPHFAGELAVGHFHSSPLLSVTFLPYPPSLLYLPHVCVYCVRHFFLFQPYNTNTTVFFSSSSSLDTKLE